MNECLITRLKGSVNDDSLPLLGTLVFDIKATDSEFFSFSGTNCTFKLYDANGVLIETAQNYLYKANLGYAARLVVENKYKLTTISAINIHGNYQTVDNILYSTDLVTLECVIIGDISKLSTLTKLKKLTLGDATATDGNIEGDISVISNFASEFNSCYINSKNNTVIGDVSVFADYNLSSLTLFSTGIYGDVASFGKSISATDLWLDKSGVSGAIEDLADSQVANGRASGSLIVHGNGIMTYNSAAFTGNKTITFSGSSYVIS